MSWLDAGSADTRVLFEAVTLCVAGIAILSVWAGLSRRHWLLRVLAVGVAILGLLPIRAYEPALLFLVVSPAIALSMLMIRRWSGPALSFQTSIADVRSLGGRVIAVSYVVIAVYLFMAVRQPAGSATRPSWYEWGAFGSLVLGAGAVAVMLFRAPRSTDLTELVKPCQAELPERFRFSLLEALLGFTVVGAVSAMVAWITRQPLLLDRFGMFGTAACITLVSVTAACFALQRRRWSLVAVGLGLSVVGSTALHTWVLADWPTAAAIVWLAPNALLKFKVFLFAFSLLAVAVMVATYLLLIAAAFGQPSGATRGSDSIVRSARGLFLCVCVATYGPLAIVYCGMITKVKVPVDALPETNGYPQILKIARELYRTNPQDSTIEDIRRLGTDPAKADAISRGYRDLFEALKVPAHVPLNIERDARDDLVSQYLPDATMLRAVSRSLDNESLRLEAADRFDEVAENGLATLRLGANEQRGGLMLNSLVGIAVEHRGVHQLSRNRFNFSVDDARDLILALEAIDAQREPAGVTIARDALWTDRAYTWRISLSREGPVVLAGVERNEHSMSPQAVGSVHAFQGATRRRDAMLRLLMVELALRVYETDQNRLPASLEKLYPKYLSAVPIDPYSGAPLVFRRGDQSYVLYSVWANGKDDGGRFGTPANEFGAEGFDLDLDVNDRTVAPPAAATSAEQ